MTLVTHSENVKTFLENKLAECNKLIKKRKRKHKIVKALYISSMILSIIGNSVVLVLTSVAVPPAVVLCVSATTTIITAVSIKFNLADTKSKICDNIRKLNIIRDKLDYVINCNGSLSKEESVAILNEFRKL